MHLRALVSTGPACASGHALVTAVGKGDQRRQTAADELIMRATFQEGDLLSAEVHMQKGHGGINLQVRKKFGKLRRVSNGGRGYQLAGKASLCTVTDLTQSCFPSCCAGRASPYPCHTH